MADQFTSPHAVKVEGGFDASNLKGKSVVVTGGASGLGAEFARAFAKAGAFVTIGDLSEENGKKVVSEIGEDKAAFAHCNVLTWSDQLNLFKTALSKSPSKDIDIVIANAGISGQDAVWKNDAECPSSDPIEPDLSILQINLKAYMYTVKLATHYFSRPTVPGADKCLIMTASLAGYLDQPGSPQYCASKWGVRGLMHSLRQTMPGMGMRVNIIAPWFVKTAILSDQVVDLLVSRGVDFAAKEDAAKAVLHFTADRSINGRCFAVVPRDIAAQGYFDLQQDDFAEGDVLTEWQNRAAKVSHRIGTK